MKSKKGLLGVVMAVAFVLTIGLFGTAYAKHGGDASMDMHHLHMLMNHGLEMVAEGSNMVMLAEMKMTAAMDPMTLEHGHQMIKEGKEVIEHALKGPEMQAMHKGGHGDDPMMKYTHELGNAESGRGGLARKYEHGRPDDRRHDDHAPHAYYDKPCPGDGSPRVQYGDARTNGDVECGQIFHRTWENDVGRRQRPTHRSHERQSDDGHACERRYWRQRNDGGHA